MALTLTDLDFLTSAAGETLLNTLSEQDLSDKNTLNLMTRLRRDYPAEQARGAVLLAGLRQKAVAKFGESAHKMLFTPDALEQASDPLVRRYRSPLAQGQRVFDAGCSIGADALAFAQAGGVVTGMDIDPVRVRIAHYNAAALDLSANFEIGDVRTAQPDADLIFFDPARRDEQGKRIFHVEQYHPPLALVRQWTAPQRVVKLSPGVDLTQLESYGGAVEFISVGGDLKEAVLWLGWDKPARTATLLLADAVHQYHAGESVTAPLSEPREWLLEPDPAILRAGLVADLALELGAYQLDETIAYLTADSAPVTPWVRAWRVLDWLPLHLKRLRLYLRERNVGRVTVKKRGVDLTPEAVTAALKLKGSETRTLILTRCQGRHLVLICADPAP